AVHLYAHARRAGLRCRRVADRRALHPGLRRRHRGAVGAAGPRPGGDRRRADDRLRTRRHAGDPDAGPPDDRHRVGRAAGPVALAVRLRRQGLLAAPARRHHGDRRRADDPHRARGRDGRNGRAGGL
ncbi:MAG: hypothetical protein AVDCRST_MAG04-2411, partial [uncultured Acetobacteraceae bacterium]